MDFGPFGLSEVIFIGLLALVLFGPRRLPELARSVGKVLTTLRRGTEDLKRSFQEELEAADGGLSKEVREAAKNLRAAGDDVRQVGRRAAAEGRKLLAEPAAVSRGGRPEAPAPAEADGEPAGAQDADRDETAGADSDSPSGPAADADDER